MSPTVVYVFLSPSKKEKKNSYEWSCPCSEDEVQYVKNNYILTKNISNKNSEMWSIYKKNS